MTYHTTEELLGRRSEWAVSPNNFNGLIDSHLLANQRIAELEAQLAERDRQLTAARDDSQFLNWLEANEAHLVSHRERCEDGWTIWWHVVNKKGRSLSGHPEGSVRAALRKALAALDGEVRS